MTLENPIEIPQQFRWRALKEALDVRRVLNDCDSSGGLWTVTELQGAVSPVRECEPGQENETVARRASGRETDEGRVPRNVQRCIHQQAPERARKRSRVPVTTL